MSRYIKSEDKRCFYYWEFDTKNGKFIGQPKLFVKHDYNIPTFSTVFTSFDSDLGHIDNSQNGTRISFVSSTGITNRSTENYFVLVTDENFKTLWSKKVTLPYKDRKVLLNRIDVSNNGNVYLLCKIYGSSDDGSALKYRYALNFVSPNETKEIKLTLDSDKEILDLCEYKYNDNILCLAGVYTLTSNKKERANGSFILKFNTEKQKTEMIKTYPFGPEMNVPSQKQSKDDKNNEIHSLQLSDWNFSDDGTITLIFDQYFLEVRTYNMGNKIHTDYIYHYNDKFITRFDSSGNQLFQTRIQNKYRSGSSGRNSNLYTLNSNKTLLAYRSDDTDGNNIMIAILDNKGKLIYNNSHSMNSSEADMIYNYIFKIDDKLIVSAKNNKKYHYGRLTVTD
ncbi:MAG: hypothetical protein NZM35_00165 [Chitinophagales bacterium]|nr:hypothetical protein [Chitinophagales bacterium]MDW8417860.1 hypothetical protein [Chitinophagales bacterium]